MLPRSLTPQQVGTGRLHARAPAAQPRRSRGASRAVRLVAHGLATSEDGLANGVMPAGEDNALETLRVTKEPGKRAELLQQLDNHFLDASLSYAPSPVEEYLIKALAPQITKYQVMMLAVMKPGLVGYDLEQQVKPAVKALLAAGLAPVDVSFLLSKNSGLLGVPTQLQRWLELLQATGLGAAQISSFLLRCPAEAPLMQPGAATVSQAQAVISYLYKLGISKEYMCSRILPLCPAVLARDIEGQLRPLVSEFLGLGMEVPDVVRLACLAPRTLLLDPKQDVRPLVAYLRTLGLSTEQVSQVLQEAPHVLGQKPQEAFGSKLAALVAAGVTPSVLEAMTKVSTRFLSAPGSVSEQLQWLSSRLGLSEAQVREVITAEPDVLVERVPELERKAKWLAEKAGVPPSTVLKHPRLLSASFNGVIGPRWDFVQAKKAFSAVSNVEGWDFSTMFAPSFNDLEFCELLGASINEYAGFKTRWEEAFSASVHADSAAEFQAEMRKLGIYEGEA